jgi:coenzyme F420 hydrogenase subunit beta
MNVIEEVVDKKWCVGCGMCAAVCPRNRLEIRWNDQGEYNPVEVEGSADCSEKCSMCYQVCPTHGKTKNETEIGNQWYGEVEAIQHTDETGYFVSSYVGYSKDHRANSASGGMATWMLERLLQSGDVNAVAAVGRNIDTDTLFEFKICRTLEEIRACSRSAYYPVETSHVIQHILNNDGNYAIIGLPCVCKAIRLAQDKMPRLKQRIKVVLGLTCGHQCSKFFAEYICALGGGNPHELKEFIFRTKDLSQPASNFGFYFRSGKQSNEVAERILWNDGVNVAYQNRYFQLPGCFYCDDVFAECADAVFMDAWLTEYIKYSEGHNLVLTRTEKIDALLNTERNGIVLNKISVNQVILSQQGVLDLKRIRPAPQNNDPILRTNVLRPASPLQHKINLLKQEIAFFTSESWGSAKHIDILNTVCEKQFQKLRLYSIILKILNLPFRVFRKISKRL